MIEAQLEACTTIQGKQPWMLAVQTRKMDVGAYAKEKYKRLPISTCSNLKIHEAPLLTPELLCHRLAKAEAIILVDSLLVDLHSKPSNGKELQGAKNES